jgi:hypothetical protein
MKVIDIGLCEQCDVQADIYHILYICSKHATSIRAKYNLLNGQTATKTRHVKENLEAWIQIIYILIEIKRNEEYHTRNGRWMHFKCFQFSRE